jgi:hypothetical protein
MYMPQVNGVVKCANCTIIKVTMNMLHAQNLDKTFRTKTIVYAIYTLEHCPTKVLVFILLKEA